MPTGSEGPQRVQSRIKVCSRSEHQREGSQRVGEQMRVDRAIRFTQMTEFGDFSHSVRDTRHCSGDTAAVDNPPLVHADLPLFGRMEGESNPVTTRRGLCGMGQSGHPSVVSIVDERFAGPVEDLAFIRSIVFDAAMPVKMVVGDIRDGRALQRQGIREMQLERA